MSGKKVFVPPMIPEKAVPKAALRKLPTTRCEPLRSYVTSSPSIVIFTLIGIRPSPIAGS